MTTIPSATASVVSQVPAEIHSPNILRGVVLHRALMRGVQVHRVLVHGTLTVRANVRGTPIRVHAVLRKAVLRKAVLRQRVLPDVARADPGPEVAAVTNVSPMMAAMALLGHIGQCVTDAPHKTVVPRKTVVLRVMVVLLVRAALLAVVPQVAGHSTTVQDALVQRAKTDPTAAGSGIQFAGTTGETFEKTAHAGATAQRTVPRSRSQKSRKTSTLASCTKMYANACGL